MPPLPAHDTAVVDKPWDGPANEARLSNDAGAATYRKVYAWRDPDKDPDTKAAYKLPHHEVSQDGTPGAANAAGCRAALSRLPQSSIPQADHDGVKRHLNRHLDKTRSSSEAAPAPWLAEVEGRVWAMRPELLATLHDLAASGASLDAAQEAMGDVVAARRAGPSVQGGVAVVKLSGVLMPSVSLIALLFGMGGGLPAFVSDLRAAVADGEAGAIVLDVDSPGGLVDLIPEIAEEVRAAREQKPVYAVANTLAASAAYWIASQADEVAVTPSGEIGSIGVYAAHRDMSRALDAAGITTTLVSAGKYKVEGNPYEPLGDEARDAMQESVNDYYDLFVRAVAAGRGTKPADVRAGYGQGRTLTAKRAVQAGLADRVETLGETIARAGRRRTPRPRPGAHDPAAGQHQQHEDGAEAEAGAAAEYTAEDRARLLAVASSDNDNDREG